MDDYSFKTIKNENANAASGGADDAASVDYDVPTLYSDAQEAAGPKVGDKLVGGRYEILSELGRGGMGVVYRCFDSVSGIEVALKALPPELSHNSDEMEEVRDNFQLVSKLVHQNIAANRTLERDARTGDYYLVMELVLGESLRQWMRRMRREKGTITIDDALPILRQVAEALDYAHSMKVMHRDIKPANIMLTADGKVKVMDFGLAAQIHTSLSHVSMAYHGTSGTQSYMAPEQWRGLPQDAAADQYALAVMAYEMLAGHLPFESSDTAVLKKAVLEETPAQIEGLTDATNRTLLRALSKKSAERFHSCQEFVASLTKMAASESPALMKRTLFKKWLFASLGILALVALFVGVSYYIFKTKSLSVDSNSVSDKAENRMLDLSGATENHPSKGKNFKVKFSDRIKIEMLWVKPGGFTMGSPSWEPGRYDNETQHNIRLNNGFWLGKYEVTHGQWKALMGTDLRVQVKKALNDDTVYSFLGNKTLRDYWGLSRDADPQARLGSEDDQVAMHYVSYDDCLEFCRRLNERERAAGRLPAGYEYALPTEAQWEYACRAGSTTALYNGPIDIRGEKNAPALDDIAWYGGNSSVGYSGGGWNTANWKEKQYPGGRAFARNVGGKKPNAWGFHDMIGNVWEWCSDWYGSYNGDATDPKGPSNGSNRVDRGGGWGDKARNCRSAVRSYNSPSYRNYALGFRLALVPVQGDGSQAKVDKTDDHKHAGARRLKDTASATTSENHPVGGKNFKVRLSDRNKMEMLWVKPGSFTMGSPTWEPGRYDDETQHNVRLTRGFWLGKYEVTHGQWKEVMGTNLREQLRKALNDDTVYRFPNGNKTLREFWGMSRDSDVMNRIGNEDDQAAMHYVSYDDCLEFCRCLNERERAAGRLPAGYVYGLPTEAQWEYACRAGTTTALYNGPIDIRGENNAPALDDIAWYGGNSSVGYNGRGLDTSGWKEKQYSGGYAGIRNVGGKKPNPWGFHDMIGNVREWCSDWYGSYNGDATDPKGPSSGSDRVARGGSWGGRARSCRAAIRGLNLPSFRHYYLGFRLALVPVHEP